MVAMVEQRSENGSTTMSIRLGNRDFALERKLVPIDQLRLDSSNQRLTYQLRSKGMVATDGDLHKLLWKQDDVKNLYESILNNGGLIEDPIVRRDNVVMEGNCRTVALRELRKKYPDDKRFEKVHVRLLPNDVTDEQLMTLLGELHVAGKIRWGAYEEAEYVWKMQTLFHKTYDYLASHLRWSRGKIAQKIAAYEETRKYLEETGDKQGINRFSHFEEFMKKRPLRERRDRDSAFMKEFRSWVFDGKLKDAKDVRELPEIMDNPAAFTKFKKGDMQGARQVLYDANPSMASSLYAIVDQATSELRTIALSELEDLQSGSPVKEQKLRDLSEALKKVASHGGIKL